MYWKKILWNCTPWPRCQNVQRYLKKSLTTRWGCFWEIYLFSSPRPCLAAAWTRAVCTTSCRWRRGSQSLTLGRKNYNFQIYLCKVLFLNRRRKKWNLFLLTVGGDGVGVRVLVAGLRQLVQLHVVHHHLGKQHSKCWSSNAISAAKVIFQNCSQVNIIFTTRLSKTAGHQGHLNVGGGWGRKPNGNPAGGAGNAAWCCCSKSL